MRARAQALVAERRFDARARTDPRPTRHMPADAVPADREALARAAGLPVVWSGPNGMWQVRLHPGKEDLIVVPRDAERIYCIGAGSLPAADPERSREACCRLAYGYRDWAMHASLVRRHADIRRELGCPPGESLWLFLRERGELS